MHHAMQCDSTCFAGWQGRLASDVGIPPYCYDLLTVLNYAAAVLFTHILTPVTLCWPWSSLSGREVRETLPLGLCMI